MNRFIEAMYSIALVGENCYLHRSTAHNRFCYLDVVLQEGPIGEGSFYKKVYRLKHYNGLFVVCNTLLLQRYIPLSEIDLQ